MAYGLQEFCRDTSAILKGEGSMQSRLDAVAAKLSGLLTNDAFVKATFSAETPAGKRELYHDPDLDYYVLAHVQEGGKRGTPHSHGASWAIYGNINGATRMREYVRSLRSSHSLARRTCQSAMYRWAARIWAATIPTREEYRPSNNL